MRQLDRDEQTMKCHSSRATQAAERLEVPASDLGGSGESVPCDSGVIGTAIVPLHVH